MERIPPRLAKSGLAGGPGIAVIAVIGKPELTAAL